MRWRHPTRGEVPFDAVGSMAATDDGVLFVAEPGGTLWRSTDGTWTSSAGWLGAGPPGPVSGDGTARPVPAH